MELQVRPLKQPNDPGLPRPFRWDDSHETPLELPTVPCQLELPRGEVFERAGVDRDAASHYGVKSLKGKRIEQVL